MCAVCGLFIGVFELVEFCGVCGESYECVADEDIVSYFFWEEKAAVEHGSAAFVEYLVDGFVYHRWSFSFGRFFHYFFIIYCEKYGNYSKNIGYLNVVVQILV